MLQKTRLTLTENSTGRNVGKGRVVRSTKGIPVLLKFGTKLSSKLNYSQR